MLEFVLIFIGAMLYVAASYYHLSLNPWSFQKAVSIAIPLVLVEYAFSLNGNRMAHLKGYTSIQILIITMSFYLVGMFFMHKFILKEPLLIGDLLAFGLVILAFYIMFS